MENKIVSIGNETICVLREFLNNLDNFEDFTFSDVLATLLIYVRNTNVINEKLLQSLISKVPKHELNEISRNLAKQIDKAIEDDSFELINQLEKIGKLFSVNEIIDKQDIITRFGKLHNEIKLSILSSLLEREKNEKYDLDRKIADIASLFDEDMGDSVQDLLEESDLRPLKEYREIADFFEQGENPVIDRFYPLQQIINYYITDGNKVSIALIKLMNEIKLNKSITRKEIEALAQDISDEEIQIIFKEIDNAKASVLDMDQYRLYDTLMSYKYILSRD